MTIDNYLHLGMPRFQTVSDAIAIMDANGIGKALACAFETCPDLVTVHQAILEAPDRFIAAGLPIGADQAEITSGIHAQFAAGFSGLRLGGDHVRDWPWVLDLIGEHDGFALVCGSDGLADNAENLLAYLDRFDNGLVIGGHFAGPRETSIFDTDPLVDRLFGHPRFAVNFSRQTLFPDEVIMPWAHELVRRVGWDRLMWGSEAPVLHWRDESIDTTRSWADRLSPTDDELARFLGGNAERLVWGRPRSTAAPLVLPFDPFDFVVSKPATMWPLGLSLDDSLPGRLVGSWVSWGGPARGDMSSFLEVFLDEHLLP